MLDMSFGELLVIGVVALVVIGPKKLPGVARTAGRMIGRMQRYVAEVKSEVQREMDLEELRKLQGTVQDAAKSVESSMRENMDGINQEAAKLESDWKKAEDELKHVSPPATMPVMGFGQLAIDAPATSPDAEVGSTPNRPDLEAEQRQQELGFETIEKSAAKPAETVPHPNNSATDR
jgi:sec-independent protein translocase protein TatB